MSKQSVDKRVSIALILLLLVSLALRLLYVQVNALSYDEGHREMFGALAAQGYAPYKEVFVGIPPLALLTMQLGVTLFDGTLSVRYPMMLYSLIGVGAIYWLVKRQAPGRPVMAGLLAAAFLSFNYRYFFLSCSMKRLLKKTGSIYVHLDWHAVHYVKSEMDKIFGYDNFRKDILPMGMRHYRIRIYRVRNENQH